MPSPNLMVLHLIKDCIINSEKNDLNPYFSWYSGRIIEFLIITVGSNT